MQVWPTNRCNLNCRFCWRSRSETSSWKNKKEIDEEIFLKAIEEGLELGLERLTVSGGGEPLIRRKLIERIIEKAGEYNTERNLITNGTLFTEGLYRKMIENSWDFISFSIHGLSPENSNYITDSKTTHEKRIDNINLLNKIKENTERPHLFAITVINKWNWKNIEKFIDFADNNDFSSIFLKIPEGDESVKGMFVNEEDLNELVAKIKKIQSDEFRNRFKLGLNMEFSIDDIEKYYSEDHEKEYTDVERIKSCKKPFNELNIFADGRVAQCCNFGFSENVVDELDENTSLTDIWFGEKMNKLRREMERGKFPDKCKNCFPTTRQKTGEDK